MPHPLDVADLRDRVRRALEGFLAEQQAQLALVGPELDDVHGALAGFVLEGGKRIRPAFAYWGWRAAGGGDCDEVVAAVSCLELVQACALIHDDVMDGSDQRRGQPSVHRAFESLHRGRGWRGDGAGFGQAAAILLGDLCLIWADALLNRSGLPAASLERARPAYDAMRVEVMAGQYLDVREQVSGAPSLERALRVARFKSAGYTVERPLQLGGLLAGCSEELLTAYSSYGVPLGEAFQLRDDLLGVFGDPAETGKPAGDDLREGKRTALVAVAWERASAAESALLEASLGDPTLDDDAVARVCEVLVSTGAVEVVEQLISDRTEAALVALDSAPVVEPEAAEVLRALAGAATTRTT